MCRTLWIDGEPYETERALEERIGARCVTMPGYVPLPPGSDYCLCGTDLEETVAQVGMTCRRCGESDPGMPGDWIAELPESRGARR